MEVAVWATSTKQIFFPSQQPQRAPGHELEIHSSNHVPAMNSVAGLRQVHLKGPLHITL